jgi:Zn finger protein HypA/HybF involved in hydrogenase expression
MHETTLLKNIFQYLAQEEKISSRRVKKICISLSEFGAITGEHFSRHLKEESAGTKWESLDVEIKKIPYGPELEITKLEFE